MWEGSLCKRGSASLPISAVPDIHLFYWSGVRINHSQQSKYLAPFHQDPTQRIVALTMPHAFGYLVLPVEPLLKLVEGREGCEITWDEWKKHAIIPSIR